MHIDGFRFDLAAIFTVTSDVSTAPPPIFAQLSAVKALQGTRLIAEPWYAGTDLLGNKFPGNTWRQWNGAYRDDLRRFVKGTTGLIGAAILRLYGSNDLFPDDLMNSNHPYQSVNFINCHDGFTLYDLVAYNNPVNSDGGSQNSWNCGWEGDAEVPQAVTDLRIRQAKNFMILLMLSNGTAMFVAGDEFLHTQGGNSNPYNKDEISVWLDWGRLQTIKDFNGFMLKVIQFRKAFSLISRSRFWKGDLQPHGFDGNPIDYTDAGLLCFAYHLADSIGGAQELYVMVNAGWTAINFTIASPGAWKQVINTYLGAGQDITLDQPCSGWRQ